MYTRAPSKGPPRRRAKPVSPELVTEFSRTVANGGSLAAASRGRCMCVEVAGASYGLPLANVQEVIGMRPITRVFHVPAVLAGIINLRGEVLPVLDLAQLLRGEAVGANHTDSRIVVVREVAGGKRRAGLCVDALVGLIDVPEEGLGATPASITPSVRALTRGIIPSQPPCVVLDVATLLTAPELAELSSVSAF